MTRYLDIIRKYATLINSNGQESPFEFKSISWLNSRETILENSEHRITVKFYANCFEIFLNEQKIMLRVIDGYHGMYCQWYRILNEEDSKHYGSDVEIIENKEIEESVDENSLNMLLAPWRE